MPSFKRLLVATAACSSCLVQLSSAFSPVITTGLHARSSAASSTQFHSSNMGGGRGSARGGSPITREQELRIIEEKVEEEAETKKKSFDAEECTIIDDELNEELKKLGDLEPLERQLIRLEGLEPYVLVSVLTATASYSTITSLEFIRDEGIDWTAAGLLCSSLGSTLCGLYSTIIFSLSILYGKTALGMDREATYFYFLDQTAAKRFRGFQAFSLSLLLFCCSILLLATDKLPEEYRPVAFLFASGFIGFGFREWAEITDSAQPIFTNVIPNDNED